MKSSVRIRLLEMERDRIMQARGDPVFVEIGLKLFPLVDAHHIEMVDRLGP